MDRLTDMITNLSGILLGCIVLKFCGFRKPAAITIMLISAFEVIVHISIGVSSMTVFGSYGQNIVYSPGLITSLFGFLPLSVAIAKTLWKDRKPSFRQWGIGIVATFCVFFLCVNFPEMLLANQDSPYSFTDRGYYEQFAEQYEIEHNVEY